MTSEGVKTLCDEGLSLLEDELWFYNGEVYTDPENDLDDDILGPADWQAFMETKVASYRLEKSSDVC